MRRPTRAVAGESPAARDACVRAAACTRWGVTVSLVLASFAATDAVRAQPPAPRPPELERLEYFVGEWRVKGSVEASGMGPAEEFTQTDTCAWFAGRYQVVCEGSAQRRSGRLHSRLTLGYDAEEKRYWSAMHNSLGQHGTPIGSYNAGVWTWEGSAKVGGKPLAYRVTTTERSPTEHTNKTEFSFDGGPWTLGETSTSTRINKGKSPAPAKR